MKAIALGLLIATLGGTAMAQSPVQDGSSLTWLAGDRVHTGANGAKVYEAFIGPVNGVVTGTALSGAGAGAYTEFHRFAPNAEGRFGLSVQNSRTNAWNFTPLKSIEPGKVVFESTDGATRITYWDKGQGVVGASVDRITNGQTTRTEWSFAPVKK